MGGGQLVLMREQFNFLAHEISHARESERRGAEELKIANKAINLATYLQRISDE